MADTSQGTEQKEVSRSGDIGPIFENTVTALPERGVVVDDSKEEIYQAPAAKQLSRVDIRQFTVWHERKQSPTNVLIDRLPVGLK